MRRLIPHWRKMTWVLLLWTAVFAVWIVAGLGGSAGHTHAYCVAHTDQFFTMKDCESAGQAGTAIGATLVFLLWFIGFVVLGLVWLMSRSAPPHLPALRKRCQEGPHHLPVLPLRLHHGRSRRDQLTLYSSCRFTHHWLSRSSPSCRPSGTVSR